MPDFMNYVILINEIEYHSIFIKKRPIAIASMTKHYCRTHYDHQHACTYEKHNGSSLRQLFVIVLRDATETKISFTLTASIMLRPSSS